MNTVIPERIKMARRMNRFSMDDLVNRMGERSVSKMAISKMERGLISPSAATLLAIADACHLPVSYFHKTSLNLGKMEFRYKTEVSGRQRQEVEAIVGNVVQQYLDVHTVTGSPLTFVHPMAGTTLRNYDDVEHAAARLRKKWEMGNQPIHSVYELLAEHGIHVLEVNFGCTYVDGVSTFVNGDIPIIIINTCSNTTTERKRFTALHELSHLLLRLCPDNAERHQQYLSSLPPITYVVTIKQPTTERLCHLFAGAMLLPEPSALRRFGHIRTEVTMDEFIRTRNLYGISIAAQIHRLHDLRIIDDGYYSHLFENVIKPNFMEEGWGQYPIMETADQQLMLEERVKAELKGIGEGESSEMM